MSNRNVARTQRLVARGRKLLENVDDDTGADRAQTLFRQAIALAPESAADVLSPDLFKDIKDSAPPEDYTPGA